MENKLVKCGKLNISNSSPFTLIAGPCQLENEKHAIEVASRLKEKFNKPTIVLTKNKQIYKGSCRSIPGVDLGLFVLKSKEKKIIINGGGHQMAAGLSIKKENLKNELHKIDFIIKNPI